MLIAAVATAACEQSIDARSDKTTAVRDTPSLISPTGTPAALGISDSLQREREAEALDLEKLHADLVALRSQQGALQIERERLTRQVESHQAEGEKKLAKLKAQWNEFSSDVGSDPAGAAARERFAERARVEMESTLMMDQEYRAALEETERKLRDAEERQRTLRQQTLRQQTLRQQTLRQQTLRQQTLRQQATE